MERREEARPGQAGGTAARARHDPQDAGRRRCRMTTGQLRAAIRRTLRSYGIVAGPDLLDELAAIADHHAAEESAAAAGAG
jgi:hypothetical protein